MIKHELDGMTTLERQILLTGYLNHPVSVQTSNGVYEGILTNVDGSCIVLGNMSYPLDRIRICVVKIGGDWCSTNKGHRPNAKVTRVQIRLCIHEKDALKVIAAQQGKTLSEFIRDAALSTVQLSNP
jgi:small nuclear ribonucleoprotein (snRNP)-like protein